MHILGKVLIWFIAVGALAATVLTAKTYDTRNSWLRKVDELEKRVEANKPLIAEKETKLRQLQEERDRLNLGWDEPILNVAGQLNQNFQFRAQDPRIVNWLSALAPEQQASQVVYVFTPNPNVPGESVYVGSFQYGGMDPGGAAIFNPTWTPRQGDYESIPQGAENGPFRVRPMVPSHYPSQYAETRTEMTITERFLADKQDDLAEQKLREADAQAILTKRNEQLQGAEGLVSRMQSAEDARNTELEELDYWRRQVKDAELKIQELMEETRRMEQQLKSPGGSQPESEPDTTV